jgi:hypothetical protein
VVVPNSQPTIPVVSIAIVFLGGGLKTCELHSLLFKLYFLFRMPCFGGTVRKLNKEMHTNFGYKTSRKERSSDPK